MHVCVCSRSKLLCRNYNNSSWHWSESGRLSHLSLSQRGLVETRSVFEARVPRQAATVGQIPEQWPALGRDAMSSTRHTFNTQQNEQTNSCQLQQGHQQNLLELTKVIILQRGSFSLFLLLYKIYMAYSYPNHFCNYQCLTVTWQARFSVTRKNENHLGQAPSRRMPVTCQFTSLDLFRFYSSVHTTLFSCVFSTFGI